MSDLKRLDIVLRIAGYNLPRKDLEIIRKLIGMAGPHTTIQQIITAVEHIEQKYEGHE